MEFLPLFFDLKESTALVFGASDAAARKVEVLLKAKCRVSLVAESLNKSLHEHLDSPLFTHFSNDDGLWDVAHIVIAATDKSSVDEKISETAKAKKLPVNVVNRADLSTFVFPSIIDRSPIIAAVSSSGELPVLTRLLRNRLEATIPHAFGRLAIIARKYRTEVKQQITSINTRRNFWENVLEGRFADLVFSGQEEAAENELKTKLAQQLSEKNQVEGEVYLVGAGPGDPDLLTFKALRLIRQADVVLYDRLVSEPILALVRQDAEKINVGKERANHLVPQDSINSLLVQYAKKGKRVLRLKGGDPFIFGRGGEEIETLAAENIPFQVVPGITAASGCASYAGIPLTHRDYSQSCTFVTGQLKEGELDLNWPALVQPRQTIVVYMGLAGLPVLSQKLQQHGLAPDTPAALVQQGTTEHQKVWVSTISELPEVAEREQPAAPTLVIIGDVVKLQKSLSWF